MRQIIFFYNYIRLAIKMKSKQQQQQQRQQKTAAPRITEFMFSLLLPLKPSSQILG